MLNVHNIANLVLKSFFIMNRFRFSSFASALSVVLFAAMIVLGGCAQDTVTGPMPETVETEKTTVKAAHNEDPAHTDDGGSTDDPDGSHNTTDE